MNDSIFYCSTFLIVICPGGEIDTTFIEVSEGSVDDGVDLFNLAIYVLVKEAVDRIVAHGVI